MQGVAKVLSKKVITVAACVGSIFFSGCGARTCAPSGASGCGYPELSRPMIVSDYESCRNSGGVIESHSSLPSCRASDGRLFSGER